MKLLRKKIAQAKNSLYLSQDYAPRYLLPNNTAQNVCEQIFHFEQQALRGAQRRTYKFKSQRSLNSKFIRAIYHFSLSEDASPYLKPFLAKESIEFDVFMQFVVQKTTQRNFTLSGFISGLRLLPDDAGKVVACKRIMESIGLVFMKYFSIDWIFKGKGCFKMGYLRLRSKLMRKMRELR